MAAHSDSSLPTNEHSMRSPVDLDEGKPAITNPNNAWKEYFRGSQRVLEEAFDEFEVAAADDKAIIRSNFATADYESSSPLLRKYSSAGIVPSVSTLSERTRGLVGGR